MRRVLALLLVSLSVFVLAAPAAAQRSEKPIDVYEVEPGLACTLTAHNGESVWPGNVLVVRNGEELIRVEGVEDAPDIFTVVEFVTETSVVSAGVEISEWSSLEAALVCSPAPTSSTTSTSVPEPTTTTTAVDCVLVRDSDACEPSTTTSSVPEPTTTTSSVPESTTTSSSVPDRNCPPDGLACTGVTPLTPLFAALGLVILAIGAVLDRWSRPGR